MPTFEEKFRALLARIGLQPNRATIRHAFRQDAALAEVLPWIAENITEAHILDPQLRQDYARFEGRLSLPLDEVEGDQLEPRLDEQEEADLERIEAELEARVAQKDKEIASLSALVHQFETQRDSTEQKLRYAYEEDDVFVSPLQRTTEEQAVRACQELEGQYNAFAADLNGFLELLSSHGHDLLFTQAHPEQYWSASADLSKQLERLMRDLIGSQQNLPGQKMTKAHQLVQLSDLQQQPWFRELERLRQCKHISEMKRLEMQLAKNRTETRCRFIRQYAEELTHNPGVLSQWKGMAVEEVKAQNKKLKQRKSQLMKEWMRGLERTNKTLGWDLVQEYMQHVCAEWNDLLIQKQEFLGHLCQHLDRNRVCTILAEIERQKLQERLNYIRNLDQTFCMTTAISQKRMERMAPPNHSPVNFIHPDDQYLQFLASFLKFAAEKIEEKPPVESSLASQSSVHKRLYSTAFSDTPLSGRVSSGMTPVSKLIKEQQAATENDTFSPRGRPITPAELESSLRRLSVQAESPTKSEADLFKDSPCRECVTNSIPFHEVTVQANRLLALPAASHQSVARLFPERFLQELRAEAEMVHQLQQSLFHCSEEGPWMLNVSNLTSSLESLDPIIQKLNQISSDVKGEFRSYLAYLQRQPDEAKARKEMAEFFIAALVRQSKSVDAI